MNSKFNYSKEICLLVFLSLTVSCQNWRQRTEAQVEKIDKTAQATAQIGGQDFAEISFREGSNELTEEGRQKLRELASDASKQGKKMEEIKILSWADIEYPAGGQKAPQKEINLAKDRARNIENYLKDDLKTDADVDTYNMAKRPYKISEIFGTDDYKTKSAFEKSGTAPTGIGPLSKKTSKAVVVIKYE